MEVSAKENDTKSDLQESTDERKEHEHAAHCSKTFPPKLKVRTRKSKKSKNLEKNESESKSQNVQITIKDTNKESNSQNKNNQKTSKKSESRKFLEYWAKEKVVAGLQDGTLHEGIIRISKKNNRIAYVSNKDQSESDYLLPAAEDRNRALEGDIVIIQLNPPSKWSGNKKTAIVVYIWQRIHTRTAVGKINKHLDSQFVMFTPRDYRIPRMRIVVKSSPFKPRKNVWYKAKITSWNDTKHAIGTLIKELGSIGDLTTEIKAIITENDFDTISFTDECFEGLPSMESVFLSEMEYREDFRNKCIFTIDPLSAHDLDDAVSCKKLNNGNFEVGVHISDVAFYLKEGTPLNKLVSERATSVYLIKQVLHMLPQKLRSECSLLPGLDKFAFSILWEITRSGQIIREHFTRSVINSCCQLAYEHAQAFINDAVFLGHNKFPKVLGGFTVRDLSCKINYLHEIATSLRKKRFDNGAVLVSNIKLDFTVDEVTGEPLDFHVHENKEANKLIEEFMLLANQVVARKILDTFPKYAFLRCHEPADQKTLQAVNNILKAHEIKLDVTSSKTLQQNIVRMNQEYSASKMAAINQLLVKAMNRAKYICAESTENSDDLFHYGLSIPIYTHFTSPIRRYADIVVHRLLEASLGYTKKHLWKAKRLSADAIHCNKQRWDAKCAQEDCNRLYLAQYIESHQPFVREAVVIDVKKRFFNVLIMSTGTILSIYPEKLGENIAYDLIQKRPKTYNLRIPNSSTHYVYRIHLFVVLKVALKRKEKTSRLEATLV